MTEAPAHRHRQWNDSSLSATVCFMAKDHSRKSDLIQQPVHTWLSDSNTAPLQYDKHYYCADTYSDKER